MSRETCGFARPLSLKHLPDGRRSVEWLSRRGGEGLSRQVWHALFVWIDVTTSLDLGFAPGGRGVRRARQAPYLRKDGSMYIGGGVLVLILIIILLIWLF
jgi:hypothetical protein